MSSWRCTFNYFRCFSCLAFLWCSCYFLLSSKSSFSFALIYLSLNSLSFWISFIFFSRLSILYFRFLSKVFIFLSSFVSWSLILCLCSSYSLYAVSYSIFFIFLYLSWNYFSLFPIFFSLLIRSCSLSLSFSMMFSIYFSLVFSLVSSSSKWWDLD